MFGNGEIEHGPLSGEYDSEELQSGNSSESGDDRTAAHRRTNVVSLEVRLTCKISSSSWERFSTAKSSLIKKQFN